MEIDPLVSILVPNYNKGNYLRDTLDSVLAQTYPNWECIIVDDHSTDSSQEILKEYAVKDSRFLIFKRPDHLLKGGNACRNFALQKSNGDFIFFLDSDDVLATFCLSQRIQSILKFPGMDFWAFPTALFTFKIDDSIFLWNVDDSNESDLSRFLRMDPLWQTSGPIYRREFILSIGGFTVERPFWQDYEVHLKALIRSSKYRKNFHLPPDVFIRNGDQNSLSRSTPFTGNLEILRIRISFLEEIFNYFQDYKVNLSREELYSFSSFYYFLTLQIFLKHGNFFLFKEKLKVFKLMFNMPVFYQSLFYFEIFLLKLSSKYSFLKRVCFNSWKFLPKYYPKWNILDYSKLSKFQIHRFDIY